jgi:glycosyltransferase involved in cell wall biosynthesis
MTKLNQDSMHVGIISECAMSHGHGTGVQMLRTFEESRSAYTHFYFSSHYAGRSEVRNSHLLDETLPFGITGKRTVAKWLRRVAIDWPWWNDDRLNARKFQRLLAAEKIRCDVMYVVVATEQHARRCLEILRQLGCPYVVHIMDLYDAEGIVPERMPAMRALLENAASVFVLTQALADEVCRVRSGGVTQVDIGAHHPPRAALPPGEKELRIALSGRIYEGIALLSDAVPQIQARWPHVRFHYCGTHLERIPQPLRSQVQFPGWLSREQVQQHLLDSHIAFLCGPWELDGLGRFSFPSRVADYFMAGLPVIAAAGPGTAARRALLPLDGSAVRLVGDASQVIEAIARLSLSAEWQAASGAARRHGEKHFSMEAIRTTILAALRAACREQRPAATANEVA